MNTIPFEITREEVLNLAAQKLVDAYCGDPDLSNSAETMIRSKVKELFENGITKKIDEILTTETEKLLSQEIVPVDIWGERVSKPTTIRAQLAQRAREFWDVKVNKDGREESWGGTPRSKMLMQEILKDEFSKAVKENADVIIAVFKTALKADATKLVTEHIDKIINLKAR